MDVDMPPAVLGLQRMNNLGVSRIGFVGDPESRLFHSAFRPNFQMFLTQPNQLPQGQARIGKGRKHCPPIKHYARIGLAPFGLAPLGN